MLGLCQAWDAAQADPHGKAMAAEALRCLAIAAGSDAAVQALCAGLLQDNGKRGPQATLVAARTGRFRRRATPADPATHLPTRHPAHTTST